MREIIIESFGTPDVLRLHESSPPVPRPGDVLVSVAYAGLNPVDHKMRDGSSGLSRMLELPAVLGRELSGHVIGAADDVDLASRGLAIGSPVFGVRTDDLRGTYAETVAIRAEDVVTVPGAQPDLRTYAGLALAGSTALTALEDDARLRPGQTLLVHGGTGGVGQLLIPLALQAGAARVLATGSAANAGRIRELGGEPIAYDEEDWVARVREETRGRGVDAIIDLHYFSTFLPSLDVLADGGRIVAVPTLADITPAQDRGISAHITRMAPTRGRLELLARSHAEGLLDVEISEVLPLAEVARGHELLETGHTRGKLILEAHA
ncbi:NADP-dependent oxidoreductase [Brachybacterium hainanense]|uniref:NADP-dependent oxidoreductase n=1 Tax=Brachybacterium hainanense TaxID=1541174 RepID=A0ABV6RE44_9MICO